MSKTIFAVPLTFMLLALLAGCATSPSLAERCSAQGADRRIVELAERLEAQEAGLKLSAEQCEVVTALNEGILHAAGDRLEAEMLYDLGQMDLVTIAEIRDLELELELRKLEYLQGRTHLRPRIQLALAAEIASVRLARLAVLNDIREYRQIMHDAGVLPLSEVLETRILIVSHELEDLSGPERGAALAELRQMLTMRQDLLNEEYQAGVYGLLHLLEFRAEAIAIEMRFAPPADRPALAAELRGNLIEQLAICETEDLSGACELAEVDILRAKLASLAEN